MALSAAPLVVSSYTLGTEIPFPKRSRVAGTAGFAGIGLRAENYWDARRAGLDDDEMISISTENGVPVLEVEYLTGWGTAADRGPGQRDKERTVFHLARTFGVRHLNAGLLEKLPVEAVAEAFGQLCDRAGDDLTVALEFMPYSGVPDLATAWEIVRSVPNAGLIVDGWHWARAGQTPTDLAPIPAERIVAVQLCDVAAEPMSPLRSESLGHRLPPGQGYGGTVELVRALDTHGVTPWVTAVEVISDELVARGASLAAQISADAARAVLAEASGGRESLP